MAISIHKPTWHTALCVWRSQNAGPVVVSFVLAHREKRIENKETRMEVTNVIELFPS